MEKAGTPDLTAIRARVRGTGGKQYWRSLEAVAETPEFQEYLHREFPQNATEWIDPVGRRSFLKLMSASLALAGVGAACTAQPAELIVPYVRQPEEEIPGRPLFFATAMTLGGVATGLLVESHRGTSDEGRRQSRSSGEPRRHRSLRPGLGADAVRSGSLEVDSAARRDSSVERVHYRRCAPACRRSRRSRAPGFAF